MSRLFLGGLRCHGPPIYKQFTLMLPVQIHLSHFSLGSLIHLVVVLMFFCGLTQGCGHPRDKLLQLTALAGQQYLATMGQPNGFVSVLPVVLLPLLQPPPQDIPPPFPFRALNSVEQGLVGVGQTPAHCCE